MARRKKDNLGEQILRGAREAVAVARGELEPTRIWRIPITARDAKAEPPPRYEGHDIQLLRQQLRASQALFASVLNVSPETVKAWEQGKRSPDGAAMRLLEIAERQPEVLMQTVARR